MKRLFSKAMLVALMISLVPVQSAQADKGNLLKSLGAAAFIATSTIGSYLAAWHLTAKRSPNNPYQVLPAQDYKRKGRNALIGALAGWISSIYVLNKLGLVEVK